MEKTQLLELFDDALLRSKQTIKPVFGWFEKDPSSFQYRFRLETHDLTSYQEYYHEGAFVGCIFDFTDEEKALIETYSGMKFVNANGFYIEPNTMIYPHLDYSPKRSLNSTILTLSGNSILRLYDACGNIVFEMPEIIDQYVLCPSKVIHSYEVKENAARLINIWHE